MTARPVCLCRNPENNLGQIFLAILFCSSHIFEDCPIKHMVIIEALAHEVITEDFA